MGGSLMLLWAAMAALIVIALSGFAVRYVRLHRLQGAMAARYAESPPTTRSAHENRRQGQRRRLLDRRVASAQPQHAA